MARGAPRMRTADGRLNQVGGRVLARRRQLKITRETLCARLADRTEGRWIADPNEIYGVEAGRRSVHDLEVLALAQSLECDACWLLTGVSSTAAET